MTRINVGISPEELPNKQLLAEHREIKRIPNITKLGKLGEFGAPTEFTLGTGHIKFFRNKQGYLLQRYVELYEECRSRGFNVTDYRSAWDNLPPELTEDWQPSPKDRKTLLQRFREKGIILLTLERRSRDR